MATLPSCTKDNPWKLKTPPGTSAYTMHTDDKDGRKILVCTVGSTVLHCDARCIGDLHTMLQKAGDWLELGGADEQKPACAAASESMCLRSWRNSGYVSLSTMNRAGIVGDPNS